MMENRQTAVALQGGAALGAFQCGVLKALYEKEQLNPVLITGVSIGALNAVLCAGGRDTPAKTLEKFWDRIALREVSLLGKTLQKNRAWLGNPQVYLPNPVAMGFPQVATGLFSTAPLYNLLHELIDFKKLNSASTQVVIAAADVETCELVHFSNHTPEGIQAEHILASMALPPYFPPVNIGGRNYWDGGTISNILLSMIPFLLTRQHSANEHLPTEIIAITMVKQQAKLPTGIKKIMDRTMDMIYGSTVLQQWQQVRKLNEYAQLVQHLGKELSPESQLKQLPLFSEAMNHHIIDRYRVFNYEQEGMAEFSNMAWTVIRDRIEAGYRHEAAEDLY